MLDHKHYLPILTAKMGELRAIRELASDVKSCLTPLLEVPPIDWDYENEAPAKTLDEQIASVADNLQKHWGSQRAYLDAYPVANEGTTASGLHPLSHIFNQARQLQLQLVPVTGLGRDPAYQAATHEIIQADQRGMCLRVLASEIAATPNLPNQIDGILANFNVRPEQVDLVIDLGPMNPQFEAQYVMVIPAYVNALPYLAQWRSLTVSGSAFPTDLRQIATGTTQAIPRTEWNVWTSLIAAGQMRRRPAFSDYAISNPEYASLDFRIIKMTANIRYTHDVEWIVVRGRVITKGQPSQYPGLARILRALPEYSGRDFSAGDRYIDDCATGADGPGSATTWRQVGTNHHLTFVVRQIANHPGL